MRPCSSVLLVTLLATYGSCAIWNRKDNLGIVQPREINVEDFLSANPGAAEDEARRVFRRQSGTDIGFTQHLNDTHYHGLVHWTGYPSEVLFILTRSQVTGHSEESWLWRSTDYGRSFNNDTVKWDNNTVIEWYYIAPLNEYLIFSDRIHRKVWVTRDEGDTYTGYTLPFTPDSFRFQSTLAPGSDSPAQSRRVLGYDSGQQTLWVSENLGQTWQRLGTNVTRYSWRVLNSTLENSTAVYFERAINGTHSNLYMSTSPYHDQDTRLFPGLTSFMLNTFVLSDEYMFVQVNNSVMSSQYSSPLWVSRNRQPFKQARFPLQTQEKHYAVVDTSEEQVFIAVYHDINSTHLYLSELEGINYTLSLNYIISPPEDEWQNGYPSFDMHVVEGIVGTFIANVKDPAGQLGSTVISYDKGGNWASLRPPTVDRSGVFINCQPPECSLHLQIQASRQNGYQSILTQDSAIGLVMASGNLGSVLVSSFSQLRLYFSRDGGFTWFEVDSGYWQFQFAGQGAIVATIQRFRATSSVKWSCNEGKTWNSVGFLGSDSQLTSINVIGMLTEIGERALHVTVFGITYPFREWLVTDLNFTSVLPNQCTEEDFFVWIPTDDRPGSRCLLGEAIEYERRNSSTCCYADPGSSRLISRSTCTCTQEDFECDFGFERIHLNSPCTPLPDFPWPPLQPDSCPENNTYTISSGYRLVAGDKCTPGEELSYFPIQRPCIVEQPDGVSLQTNVTLIRPNIPIQFTLTQFSGGKILTTYVWDFNDSSAVINTTGYNQSRYQVHTFAGPGVYNVTVMVSNSGGSYFLPYPLTILDPVSTVSIQPPSQFSQQSELPAGVQLLFGSQVTTQYGTSLTGDLQYIWNFGDAGSPPPSAPAVSHTFVQPGEFVATLSVFHSGFGLVTSPGLSVHVLDRLISVSVSHPDVLVAGQHVTFTPHITTRYNTTSYGELTYQWDFGDGHNGPSSQPSVQHDFSSPGNFTLSLNVSNSFSWRVAVVNLVLLDAVTSVSITPLIQLTGDQLPAQLRVVFEANITTQYSTSITGSLVYQWQFGDGSDSITTSGPTTSHTFTRGGVVTVQCVVTSPANSVSVTRSFTIFEASQSVQITSAAVIGNLYVETKQRVEFSVDSIDGSGHIIPPDTHFTWHVIPVPSCLHTLRQESPLNKYNVTFPCWGEYDVSVVGNHSAGSFVAQLHLIAEAPIHHLSVSGVPRVTRSGALVSPSVHSGESSAISYAGPIAITILSANGSFLASSFNNTLGLDTLNIKLSRDDNKTKSLVFMASNDVSNTSLSLDFALAVEGEYGQLRFLFTTSLLPGTHTAKAWQNDLESALIAKIWSTYLTAFPNSYVEVEKEGFTQNTSTSEPSASPLSVRSEGQEFFFVDVNLLPQSLQQHDIEAIRNVSSKIQVDVAGGGFTMTVRGSSVTVTSVELRDAGPVVIVQPVNWRLYTGVGVGLGVGLLLVMVVAVILGVALYAYRRRYATLNVRYARLRQTPVRFTFTQGGEMVEDEDYEEPSPSASDDDDEADDVKMKSM